MALPTLAEVKVYLFGSAAGIEHDAELTDLLATSVEKVADMVGGPLLTTTVTETIPSSGGLLFLPSTTSAVASVALNGTTLDATSYGLRYGLLTPVSGWYGDVTVTYTAGYAADALPARVRRAVLRYVKWQWSRDHGGSESYLPQGDDAVPGLGIDGIEKELRSILGDLVSTAMVA